MLNAIEPFVAAQTCQSLEHGVRQWPRVTGTMPRRLAERYKLVPIRNGPLTSGDRRMVRRYLRMDEDGFLYFIAHRDEMIKTSGYRVSPNGG